MGAITNVVRRYVPASYKAMIGPSDTDYYTQADLQSIAQYVQYRLFATFADEADEATVYDPQVLEYIGKVTTLKYIPAAIDYWMDQYEHESATGTNERIDYPSRLAHLREVRNNLEEDVAEETPILFGRSVDVPDVTYGDNGRDILLTPDPQCWPQQGRPYERWDAHQPWE